MGIRNWGALLSWVALPGIITGFVSLGCIAAAGPSYAVSAGASIFPQPLPTTRDLARDRIGELRRINVTPGQLAVLGPADPSWGRGEAPVAERDPLVPFPEPAPVPSPNAIPGIPPAAGPGGMPGAGASPDRLPNGADAELIFADPRARSQMLDQLYDALSASPDAEAASRVQDAIQTIWLHTGSPTIDVLLQRSIRLGQEGDYDVALEILNAAISLSPDTAETWHQRAMVHFLRDEHSKALADLRRTLALDPKHYEAISGLARVLEHLGQKESALAVYRRALQINPYLEPAQLAVEELAREIEGQDI